MQTALTESIKQTLEGAEADAILRSCVHCGFCTATCPTYQLLGDELDGPRGRIYLIKNVLEGQPVTATTQRHLDRCLTCRACETTCPSGVRYGRLVEIGREIVEQQVPRSWHERIVRRALRLVLPFPRRFGALLRLGQAMRRLLPAALARKVPAPQVPGNWPERKLKRTMLVLEGCAQRSATPNTNASAARVLDRLGISLVRTPQAHCCGALSLHLAAREEALQFMRANIDAWWPHIEQGCEGLMISASGCGAVVREYGAHLAHDPKYAAKAMRVSELTRDLGEVLAKEDLSLLGKLPAQRIAFHAPCTLQHGQKLPNLVEPILTRLGAQLTHVVDGHLCCGSAGAYSILQPTLSQQLLRNKVDALQGDRPDVIVTANVGCQLHLATAAGVPVKHWIEIVDEITR